MLQCTSASTATNRNSTSNSTVATAIWPDYFADKCDCKCCNPWKEYNPDYFRNHIIPGSFVYLDEDKNLKEVYIKKVMYSNPATIVFWSDGTKTVSKCHAGDAYSPEAGLVLCILKKTQGKTLKGLFEAWIPYDSFSHTKQNIVIQTLSNVRKLFKKK